VTLRGTPSPARPANKRTNTEGLGPVRVRHLTTARHSLALQHGSPMRRREIRERVIRLMRVGYADVWAGFARHYLGVLDPQCEITACNVDKERPR
jgi:hypothetical protein